MVRRTMIALALVGLGWIAARAQAPAAADFELSVVTTPDGRTTVECARGCGLQPLGTHAPNRIEARDRFVYGPCRGAGPQGCPSGRIGGWITR